MRAFILQEVYGNYDERTELINIKAFSTRKEAKDYVKELIKDEKNVPDINYLPADEKEKFIKNNYIMTAKKQMDYWFGNLAGYYIEELK